MKTDAGFRFAPVSLLQAAALLVLLAVLAGSSSAGADIRVYSLHQAVLSQDFDAAKELLNKGAPVNSPGQGEHTALHLAAALGWAEGLELLLGYKADVDARERYGWTPLHFAAAAGHGAAAEVLVKAGADIEAGSERGSLRALHRAGLNGHYEVVGLLLEAGAEVDARSEDRRYGGMTPLHWAAAGASEGNTRAVKLLLDAGAEVNSANQAGMTALHWAVLSDNPGAVKALVKAGADVEAMEDRGRSARLFAVRASEETRMQLTPRVNRLPRTGWRIRFDPEDRGREEEWHRPDLDDAGWERTEIEKAWQAGYIGAAWYRRWIELPERPAGRIEAELKFEGVDENAWVWVNGEYAGGQAIGPAGWDRTFTVDAADKLRWGGRNQITVRVKNSIGAGGIWRPIMLEVREAETGAEIELSFD